MTADALRQLNADEPITASTQDDYEIAPFCEAMARAITNLDGKRSFVIALNGPWGVGKSSAVNIVKEKLTGSAVVVVNFNPWNVNGRDDLAWEFLTLIAAQLDEGAAKPIKKVARNLRRRGKGAAESAGGLFGAGAALLDDFTWQNLHADLSKSLAALPGQKRFLVVVDDIDRLDHEEVFEVFRLIKTIGHLPRVSYLLVFDEAIATKAIEKRYRGEGEGIAYLEKIIQVAFELPMPSTEQLVAAASKCVEPLRANLNDDNRVEFENMLHELISPSLATPRDIARLGNHIDVAWAAVSAEVASSDFMGVQALRAFYPAVFRALPQNKAALIRSSRGTQGDPETRRARFDRALAINTLPDERAQRIVRAGLQRLFPVLQGVWSNMFFDDTSYAEWRLGRRVCTTEHFDAYFRLSPSAYALPVAELNSYRDNAGDVRFLRTALAAALAAPRRPTGTRASLVLEELTLQASVWSLDVVAGIVTVAAEMADQLDVAADEERGFSIGTNALRVRWLLNEYVKRIDGLMREEFLRSVIAGGALGFSVLLANSLLREHEPPSNDDSEPREPRVSAQAARELQSIGLARLQLAAANGSLLHYSRPLATMLYRWFDWGGEDDVRNWIQSQLHYPETVRTICEAVTQVTWSQGLGMGDGLQDHVALGTPRVDAQSLARIMDFGALERRVEELLQGQLSPEQREAFVRFQAGVAHGRGSPR